MVTYGARPATPSSEDTVTHGGKRLSGTLDGPSGTSAPSSGRSTLFETVQSAVPATAGATGRNRAEPSSAW